MRPDKAPHVRPVDALFNLYYNHPAGCRCGCKNNTFSLIFCRNDDDIISEIWQNGAKGVNDKVMDRYGKSFDKAVTGVFNENTELSNKLRLNASRFATYKSYKLTQKLDGLRNQSGMTKDEYERQAKKLIGIYNGHQTTECSTMIARARTAKQFERFKEESERYPNIEWIASRSANARDLHQSFSGIIRPIDDAFWKDNSPGNLYNCKCSWKTTDKQVTDAPTETARPHDGLDGNPANTGELFTDKHPYFNPDKDGADLAVTELPKKNDAGLNWLDKKAMLEAPDEVAFIKQPDGFFEHILLGEMRDKNGNMLESVIKNREMARLLTQNGYTDIRLMPEIYKSAKSLRLRYFGEAYLKSNKNPDAFIGKETIEFKGSGFKNKSKRVLQGTSQSDIIFYKPDFAMKPDNMTRFVKGQFDAQDRLNLKKLFIYNDGKLYTFERP